MPSPSFREALKVWTRIGLLSFGGPAGQIALMHRELVDGRRWLTDRQYLNALSFCMLLPGPEAMQLATYAGWRLHGTRGGLAAGLLFVFPGAIVVLCLAAVYAQLGEVALVDAGFLGVKAAVVMLVVEALLRVARRSLHLPEHRAIALLAFVAIFFFGLPFPLLIAVAAAFGAMRGRAAPEDETPIAVRRGSVRDVVRTAVVWLAIWWVPLLAVREAAPDGVLPHLGVFFSKLAVVTFGGAYAVLSYMAQDVVHRYGWLTAGEMMDGLGLAETTPGPLILVTEFVGYLAAFREGGVWLGVAGALVTLWATFAPCFLWIFAGAPHIDWIASQPRLRGALSAITAAVVGVILNLTIWFALHVFFADVTADRYGPLVLWRPAAASVDLRVIALSTLAAFLLFRRHWGIARVLVVSSLGGVLFELGGLR